MPYFEDNLVINAFANFNKLICEFYHLADDVENSSLPLIFPENKGCKRISEQEIKYLFCKEIWDKNITFSIETPTIQKYKFSGKEREISGNIDVCIHEKNGKRLNNIEFKAHHTGNFGRDFEKLRCENGDNIFIHIIDNHRYLYSVWITYLTGEFIQ